MRTNTRVVDSFVPFFYFFPYILISPTSTDCLFIPSPDCNIGFMGRKKNWAQEIGFVGSAFWSAGLLTTATSEFLSVNLRSLELIYVGWGLLGGIGWVLNDCLPHDDPSGNRHTLSAFLLTPCIHIRFVQTSVFAMPSRIRISRTSPASKWAPSLTMVKVPKEAS
jgi:hypothetical protein